MNGIQEVRGSIPLISTREKYLQKSKCFFFVCFLQKGEKGIEGAAVTTVRWTALKVKVCFVGYRFALWGNCLLCVNYHCFFIKSRCLFSYPQIPGTRAFLCFTQKKPPCRRFIRQGSIVTFWLISGDIRLDYGDRAKLCAVSAFQAVL